MMRLLESIASIRHYPEKTQVFWELVWMLLIVGVAGWGMVTYAKEAWKALLFLVSMFYVAWLVPPLWQEFVAWIGRRLHRKETR
jgi:hypothetical protein